MDENLILNTDSYKASHYLQYPPGTTGMFSYMESRGGAYPSTVFFGLQMLLMKHFLTPITHKMVDEAKDFFLAHGLPFPEEGWRHVVHDLHGKLPIRIKAPSEGSVIPTGNVLVTVESTDASTFWLVTWIETALMHLWYPITVATRSHYAKRTIFKYLQETADDPQSEIMFKLHDFGGRGVTCREAAEVGGAAHLVNFMGSDTVAGVVAANRYYGVQGGMAAFSIPAAEHSTITAWGQKNEEAAYRNMLDQFAKPGKLVAVVSDSYDIFNACETLWGEALRQRVVDSGATVVIRPDSGDPVQTVCKVLAILDSKFGSGVNTKGFKVLKNVRVIQGDGMDEHSLGDVLEAAKKAGFSASNLAFGMGGGLLQKLDRDTLKFAYKCSAVEIDGVWVPVRKNPTTSPWKASKAGRMELKMEPGPVYSTVENAGWQNALSVVYENGELRSKVTLDQVRVLADLPLASATSR